MEEKGTNGDVLAALSNGMADAVEKAGRSVVKVNARRRWPASGVIYAEDLVLTASHAVERDEDLSVTRVTGPEIHYVELPLEQVRQAMGEDGARMFEWFDQVGYSADIAALRRDHPEVAWHSFEEWAKEQDWRALG